MNSCIRKMLNGLAVALLVTITTAYANPNQTAGLGLRNTHEARPPSQITSENISRMQHLWTYETTDPGQFDEFAGVEVMPLKVGNVLYFPSANGFMHAVNARTGKRIWRKSFETDYSAPPDRIHYVSRNTPLVKGNVLYLATTATILNVVPGTICETSNNAEDCLPASTGTYLLAINRLNGNLIGVTQLDHSIYSQATASPVMYKNRIIVTLSSNEEIASNTLDPDQGSNPDNPFLRCCRFRGKTVAVDLVNGKKLASEPAWTFYHTPSFDGPNNKSRLPDGAAVRVQFEADLAAFDDARRLYSASLDPINDSRYLPYDADRPHRENFSGAGSWTKGNPSVDRKRGLVMVSPGSNYGVPDLVKQCQRVRQGNITPIPGNTSFPTGALDPEAFMPPGFNCDNINQKLDNYVNTVVALDIDTGQPYWTDEAMRPQDLENNAKKFAYDTWNTACDAHDAAMKSFPANTRSALQGEDLRGIPPLDIDFRQQTECDSLVKPDDLGFAQIPMILGNVKARGPGSQPIDIAVVGQKSGDLYRFDVETGGQIFYERQKLAHSGVEAGLSYPYASDGALVFVSGSASSDNNRDVRKLYRTSRDDDSDKGGTFDIRRGDARLPARNSGPRDIRTLVNPSPDSFIDADVEIRYDRACSDYVGGSFSRQLCQGIDPFTGGDNADFFRINEFGDNPYKRRVTVVRDWRGKLPGDVLDDVLNPNSIENPIPENAPGTPGNTIMTVRDLNDCSGAVPETCAIKTSGGFWIALDAASGDIVWTRTHPSGGQTHGALTLSGDILYAAAASSENLYIDITEFPFDPRATAVPAGGGLRYGIDKHTGEILFRFHDELTRAGVEVDEYVVANPLVTGEHVFWGSGWGHYNAADFTHSGNKLHAFVLDKPNTGARVE